MTVGVTQHFTGAAVATNSCTLVSQLMLALMGPGDDHLDLGVVFCVSGCNCKIGSFVGIAVFFFFSISSRYTSKIVGIEVEMLWSCGWDSDGDTIPYTPLK